LRGHFQAGEREGKGEGGRGRKGTETTPPPAQGEKMSGYVLVPEQSNVRYACCEKQAANFSRI